MWVETITMLKVKFIVIGVHIKDIRETLNKSSNYVLQLKIEKNQPPN